MATSWKDWVAYKEYLTERKRQEFLDKWNSMNEGSYEGSFEELGIEEKVAAQAGDFSGLGSEQKDELKLYLETFISRTGLGSKTSWLFPQMLAEFAKLPLVKNEYGKYSARALLNNHIKPSDTLTGMYVLCKYAARSSLIKGQTDAANRNYSSLVPLVMSAFKKHLNIAYSEWERDEIAAITEDGLAAAMLVNELPDMTAEEVLSARDSALTPRSGAKAGVARSPLTTYTLYVTKEYPDLLALPPLARIMMCQTWCAHPSNRTEYMVTNPLKWDEMPEPLVSAGVFRRQPTQAGERPVDTSFTW